MNKFLIGAVGLVAATTLTACGSSHTNANTASSSSTPTASMTPSGSGGGGGSGADTVKAEIKVELLKHQTANSPFKVTDAEAGCVASAAVDGVGLDRLRAYGVIDADNKLTGKKLTGGIRLSTADATVVVNAFFDCVGDTQFTKFFQQEIAASMPASATSAQKACVESKITLAAVKRVIIAELTGNTAAVTQLETAAERCMVP